MGSLFVDMSAQVLAPTIAALSAAAAVVAVAMATPEGGRLPRRAVLAVGWGMSVILIFAVPDVRLLRDFAYLAAGGVGFVEKCDWPAANQLICLGGGLLWAAATLEYQRRTRQSGTITLDPADEELWARRGRALTLAAVLLPVPYELVRWAWAFGWPVGVRRGAEIIEGWSGTEQIGMFVIGALPLLGGLLTHGLTQRWGEEFPGWMPGLGGRAVPVALLAVPAALVSILIITERPRCSASSSTRRSVVPRRPLRTSRAGERACRGSSGRRRRVQPAARAREPRIIPLSRRIDSARTVA